MDFNTFGIIEFHHNFGRHEKFQLETSTCWRRIKITHVFPKSAFECSNCSVKISLSFALFELRSIISFEMVCTLEIQLIGFSQ